MELPGDVANFLLPNTSPASKVQVHGTPWRQHLVPGACHMNPQILTLPRLTASPYVAAFVVLCTPADNTVQIASVSYNDADAPTHHDDYGESA